MPFEDNPNRIPYNYGRRNNVNNPRYYSTISSTDENPIIGAYPLEAPIKSNYNPPGDDNIVYCKITPYNIPRYKTSGYDSD